MKKVLSVFLALLFVCFITVCSAEDFTLHGGVTFGMTKEEVINTERDLPFSEPEKGGWWYPSNLNRIVSEDTTVAGRDGTTIVYCFDDDGKLNAMLYTGSDFWREAFDNDKIIATMTEKYGQSVSKYVDFNSKAFSAISLYLNYQKENPYDEPNLTSLYQWIVHNPDGSCVDIQLAMIRNNGNFNDRIISYSYRTSEEVKAISDQLEFENQSMNDDL